MIVFADAADKATVTVFVPVCSVIEKISLFYLVVPDDSIEDEPHRVLVVAAAALR